MSDLHTFVPVQQLSGVVHRVHSQADDIAPHQTVEVYGEEFTLHQAKGVQRYLPHQRKTCRQTPTSRLWYIFDRFYDSRLVGILFSVLQKTAQIMMKWHLLGSVPKKHVILHLESHICTVLLYKAASSHILTFQILHLLSFGCCTYWHLDNIIVLCNSVGQRLCFWASYLRWRRPRPACPRWKRAPAGVALWPSLWAHPLLPWCPSVKYIHIHS